MYEFMTSSVWKYLEVGRENYNVKTGTCTLCETKLRCNGGSSNGLWLHMQDRPEQECERKIRTQTIN